MKLPEHFSGATMDSRAVKPGMLFVALKGSKVDGHDFIPQALAAGASGVIDGLDELTAAAAEYRRSLSAKVVGVTGSVGKTTTKEILRALLSRLGPTHATAGNFNNHIGLPLTVLNTPRDAKFLVLEMGTNHPGEIAALCDIALPDSGLVTSIGTAHLEFFKTRENIAREKGELVRRARDFGVVSRDCDQLAVLRSLRPQCLVEAESHVDWISEAIAGVLPGRHNVSNASLAFALAREYGLEPDAAKEAFATISLPGGRWKREEIEGILVINDAYNANPTSMAAVLDSFAETAVKGRRIAVLGDMFELGDTAEALHREVGAKAGAMLSGGSLDMLVAVGRQSCSWLAGSAEASGGAGKVCRAQEAGEAGRLLAGIVSAGDAVLFKASRSMELEKAIEALKSSLAK